MSEQSNGAGIVPARRRRGAVDVYKQRQKELKAMAVAKRLEERRQIVALVLAGMTYAEIARQLGKAESTIAKRFNAEMERNARATEEARALMIARVDRSIWRWWDLAHRPETVDAQGNTLSPDERKERAERADKAQEHLLRLYDQYAKLTNLYHPTEVKLTGDVHVEVSVPELNAKFEQWKREELIAEEARRPATRPALPAVSHDG